MTLARNCADCSDELRVLRNCQDESSQDVGFVWASELRRCPLAVIDPMAWEIVRWFFDWRNFGVLPFGGNDLMTQPAYVLESFRICQQHANESERRRFEGVKNGRG